MSGDLFAKHYDSFELRQEVAMPSSVFGPEVQALFDGVKTTQSRQIRVGGETRTIPTPFPRRRTGAIIGSIGFAPLVLPGRRGQTRRPATHTVSNAAQVRGPAMPSGTRPWSR